MFPHHDYRTLSGLRSWRTPGSGVFSPTICRSFTGTQTKVGTGACITELRPFTLHPGCVALHYAQGVFEGLKAYGRADRSVWLFRPLLNARRFRESAVRLALPQLSDDLFLSSLISLVQVDRAWVPTDDRECSLYLRPFMFGSEVGLAVRPSPRVTYAVIASPAAPYFPGGINGMWLWVGNYPRAWQGGYRKCQIRWQLLVKSRAGK